MGAAASIFLWFGYPGATVVVEVVQFLCCVRAEAPQSVRLAARVFVRGILLFVVEGRGDGGACARCGSR